jgi:hypothetical protein
MTRNLTLRLPYTSSLFLVLRVSFNLGVELDFARRDLKCPGPILAAERNSHDMLS